MPSFLSSTFLGLPPAISITLSGGVTYEQFKQSLGSYVYYVNKIYLYSGNPLQIQGAFFYQKYDVNGNTNSQSVISAISPYQFENSIYLETKQKNLVIDGRDFVKFTMQPNTTLSLKLFVNQISVGDDLDEKGINSFLEYERNQNSDFFDDYNEVL